MEKLLYLIILIFILILSLFYRHYRISKKYPPGPLGLPIVGQLPFHILRCLFPSLLPKISEVKYFREMRKKYGQFWSEPLGNQRIFVLASFDILKEAFIDNAMMFSGRSNFESFKIISGGNGLSFIDGPISYNERLFAMRALREHGMGKEKMEIRICDEVHEFIQYIQNNLSKHLESPHVFVKHVSNVTSRLIFNDRNKSDDPEFETYIKNLKYLSQSNDAQNKLEMFSKILKIKYSRKIFPEIENFIKSKDICVKFITNKCRSRIEIEGEYSKPICVFDYFWRYRYQDNPEITFDDKLKCISQTMFDLFFGGTDTTTNMLAFSCLMLGQYEEIQKELKAEIHSVVDDYKLINLEMKKQCPKILSFIDEIQRYFYLVPKVFHRTLASCIFRGYKIQPNDFVFGDLATIMRDPEFFENPDVFDPYRFMDESRTKYIPNKRLIPFGIGKRACPGESIAIMELFLFLSKIIHRFGIAITNKTKTNINEILEGDFAIVHAPLDHEIIFI